MSTTSDILRADDQLCCLMSAGSRFSLFCPIADPKKNMYERYGGQIQSHQGPYRGVYYSGCSAGVSLSSLGYRPSPVWIAVERWAASRLTWFRLHRLLTEWGRATWGKILTSSLNAPITVSLSWSKQVFILSRRFLSMSGFLSCKRKTEQKKNN